MAALVLGCVAEESWCDGCAGYTVDSAALGSDWCGAAELLTCDRLRGSCR